MKGRLNIVYADITDVTADAIVNSANRAPICGGSTEAHIYNVAGYEELLEERRKIGPLKVCEVASTPAFRLKARHLIFVSAPRWNFARSGEETALAICYRKILEKAVELGCKSVATSLLSSGAYRFPKGIALQIARDSIGKFFGENPDVDMDVRLVLYDGESRKTARELFGIIEDYIDLHYEPSSDDGNENFLSRRNTDKSFDEAEAEHFLNRSFSEIRQAQNLDSVLENAKDAKTFRDRMEDWMREKNISPSELQRNADIDRRHFSKIRGQKDYRTTKSTAIAIAVGLGLGSEDACELISLAGFALSPSSRSDLIVRYFFENRNLFFRENANKNQYTVAVLNDILTEHGEEVLGYSRHIKADG